MSKRQGKGGGASSSLSKAATITDNDDDEKAHKLAEEAVRSIQKCYKTVFVAVFIDVITTILDNDILSKIVKTNNNGTSLSWVDFVDLIDSFCFFVFGCGLFKISQYYVSEVQGSGGSHNGRIKDENLVGLLRTMSISWGFVALNFAIVSVSMATALPAHGRNGPLGFLLSEVSPSNAALVAVCILIIGSMAINAYCSKNAYLEDSKDNGRISTQQQNSKMDVTFLSSRRIGYRAYRNQALCVMTFTLTAIMELLKWVVNGDGGILGRLFSISDVLAPFALTWLLFCLNKSFLRAAIVRLRGDDGTNTADEEVYNSLFIAQTGFYEKVAETMKEATIYRLVPYIVSPFGPQILSALEEVSPSAAEKVVQLLDIIM